MRACGGLPKHSLLNMGAGLGVLSPIALQFVTEVGIDVGTEDQEKLPPKNMISTKTKG